MDVHKAIEIQKSFVTEYKCKTIEEAEEIREFMIVALEELQQYHQIGTADRFAALEAQMKPHVIDGTCCPQRNCNKCDRYRKELEEYHKIGTVDECMELREKHSDGDLNYEWTCPNCGEHYDEWQYDCPNCGYERYI